jgi:hypothetical protein
LYSRRTSSNWEPFHGIAVEEWPGRNDNDECEGGSAESNPHGELDVLQVETNKERDDLPTVSEDYVGM